MRAPQACAPLACTPILTFEPDASAATTAPDLFDPISCALIGRSPLHKPIAGTHRRRPRAQGIAALRVARSSRGHVRAVLAAPPNVPRCQTAVRPNVLRCQIAKRAALRRLACVLCLSATYPGNLKPPAQLRKPYVSPGQRIVCTAERTSAIAHQASHVRSLPGGGPVGPIAEALPAGGMARPAYGPGGAPPVREAAAHGSLPRLQGGPGLPLPLRGPGLPMPRTVLVPGPGRMPRRAAGLGDGVRRARVGLGAGPGCRLALPRSVRAAPRAASSRSRVTAAAPNAQFSLRVDTRGPWPLLGFARPSRPGPPRPWRGRPCAPRRYPAPGSSWTRRPPWVPPLASKAAQATLPASASPSLAAMAEGRRRGPPGRRPPNAAPTLPGNPGLRLKVD